MAQYYFTVSSLPHLKYQMENIPTIAEFLNICEDNLSKIDFKLLSETILDDFEKKKTKNKILNTWYIWEMNLRNKLVLLRAKKKGEDAEDYLKENPEILTGEDIARGAFEHDSPLAAEDILYRARWNYLNELELGHYFDTERLLIYYLKLQLLNKMSNLNREQGTERFNSIIQKISTDELDKVVQTIEQ